MVETIRLFLQLTIGLIFIQAVIGKLGNIQAFTESVEDFAFFKPGRESLVVWTTIAIEFIICVTAFLGFSFAMLTFVLSSCLLISFSILFLLTLNKNIRVRCNCFGADSTPLSKIHLLRNVICIAMCVGGIITSNLAQGTQIEDPLLVSCIFFLALSTSVIVSNFEFIVELRKIPMFIER